MGKIQDHHILCGKENTGRYVEGYKMSVVSGKPVSAVVEHVRDGTTLRVLLIPDFIQARLTGKLFIN